MTTAEAPSHRFLTAVAFLAVAALTAGAFVLSYDDLHELALAGMDGRNTRYAWVYPAMYDGLVVTGLIAVFMARDSRWITRAMRWGLLLLLIGGAITISVQRSLKGFGAIDGDGLNAGIASAPWVVALLAIWLWMAMFRQLRSAARARSSVRLGRRKPPAHARTDPAEMIPGFVPEPPAEVREEQEPEEFRVPYEVQTAPEPTLEDLNEHDEEPAAEDPFVGVREVPRRPPVVPVAPAEDTVEDFPTDDLYRDEEPAQKVPDPYTDTVEDALPRPPSSLPTDVKLVGRANDTQPDFPAPGEDRAEDPDAGGDDWASYAPEWNPPSGSLRSGPVPPEE